MSSNRMKILAQIEAKVKEEQALENGIKIKTESSTKDLGQDLYQFTRESLMVLTKAVAKGNRFTLEICHTV
jgi:hypothetical protein